MENSGGLPFDNERYHKISPHAHPILDMRYIITYTISMEPPICALCGKDFRHSENEGGLVYFALTDNDKAWHEKQREKGFTGHPPEAAWFCGEHYEEAKKLNTFTRPEAMKKLREIFAL